MTRTLPLLLLIMILTRPVQAQDYLQLPEQDYAILLQDEIDEIFSPSVAYQVRLRDKGLSIGRLSCNQAPRRCVISSPTETPKALSITPLDENFFFAVISPGDRKRNPLQSRRAKLIKSTDGYLYIIDHSYARPAVLLQIETCLENCPDYLDLGRLEAPIPVAQGDSDTPAVIEHEDPAPQGDSLEYRLERIRSLHQDGLITDEEFREQRRRVLSEEL